MNVRIVIPTRNAGPPLVELLRRLRAQEPAAAPREIVVIDSDSDDGTRERAQSEGARVIRIAHADFNHGATRTRAALDGDASAEAFVFLVQDALPADSRFLAALLAPLAEPDVAGAYARVLPTAEASALVKRDVMRDLTAGAARLRKRVANAADLAARPAGERRVLCHFNNVASAIRADAFRRLPFRPLPFGEDLDWGKRALEAGHTIAFAADAVVVHAHRSGWRRDFLRHREDAAIERALFGIERPPSLSGALARAARMILRDFSGDPPLLAPVLRLAQSLGRWRGVRRPIPRAFHAP